MNLEHIGLTVEDIKLFLLVLTRVSTLLFLTPIFGGQSIHMRLKAGLALVVSALLFPVVKQSLPEFPESWIAIVNLVAGEVIIGMTLGLIVYIFFAGIQLAGELAGFQIGFSIINVIDPQSGVESSVLAQFGYWIAIVAFFIFNGHHVLLRGLKESFDILHVGSIGLSQGLFETVNNAGAQIFSSAIKIGAPVIVVLLMVSAGFGICARFIPQMNILIISFPIQIVVGLIFFGLSLSIMLQFIRGYIDGLDGILINAMRLMKA